MEDSGSFDSETPFFELPQELIWKMLYYLPPRDALNFCETHRGAAKIICHNNDFWFEKILRDFGNVYGGIEDIPLEDRYGTYKKYWEKETFFSCVKGGHLECVKSLLELGVDPNIKTGSMEIMETTALIMASVDGNTDMIQLLLDHNADPNMQFSNQTGAIQSTALFWATGLGHTDSAQLLLEHGADPSFTQQWY